MTIQIQLNKLCRKCKVEKPKTEFTSAIRNKDGHSSYCKPCCAKYVKELRAKKPQIKKRHIGIRGYIWQMKMQMPCVRCGVKFPNNPEAMEFDHLPQYKKSFSISNPPWGTTDEILKEELAKCQLLCACCHRIVTIERRQHKDAVDKYIANMTDKEKEDNIKNQEIYNKQQIQYRKEYNQVILEATLKFIEDKNKDADRTKEKGAEKSAPSSVTDILSNLGLEGH